MKRFYDYRCPECDFLKENVYMDIDKDPCPVCEKCGVEMKRLLSAVPVQYKCGGFYTTDYKNKG